MPRSLLNRSRYESSDNDPSEMSRYRRNSRVPRFAAPSAIFVGAERAARRVRAVSWYRSVVGQLSVTRYTSSASSWVTFQASNFSYGITSQMCTEEVSSRVSPSRLTALISATPALLPLCCSAPFRFFRPFRLFRSFRSSISAPPPLPPFPPFPPSTYIRADPNWPRSR